MYIMHYDIHRRQILKGQCPSKIELTTQVFGVLLMELLVALLHVKCFKCVTLSHFHTSMSMHPLQDFPQLAM